jgi:hypothetical protein
MSKYGDLIKEARKSEASNENNEKVERTQRVEKNNSRILEKQKTTDFQNKEEKLAGISIKVPERMRRHWVVESKRKGKSMTSVIIEALSKEFGEP